MSLKEYQRKRDFKKTPEPSGTGAPAAPGRHFVVQKHAARRLHYDFRLELDGTLKSWAVPKGPSLDPGVKSLAVHVEDHPLDYAAFEGVIPQGEYGGGTVMVWDRGTWEPQGDPAKSYRAGKLKFHLHGEKLRGSWSLIRMSGRAGEGGKYWLLVKRDDEEAKSSNEADIVEDHPESVLSGRDMQQIASDADRVWSSRGKQAKSSSTNGQPKTAPPKSKPAPPPEKKLVGTRRPAVTPSVVAKATAARKTRQPAELKPQLATLASAVPEGDNWLHELKFDGYRLLALVKQGKVRLVTRNGNDWTHRFASVAAAVADLGLDSGILDGEIVSLSKEGISNFQQLQNTLKRGDTASLVYYLFDIPYLLGYDLRATTLLTRKKLLAQILLADQPANDGTLRYSDHILGQGSNVLQHACRSAMEGVISKRADSHYQQGRSTSWLKIKCLKRQEFVIGGYTAPSGARQGFGALLIGYYDDDQLQFAGRVGTGFTNQSLKELKAELKKREANEPPFVNPPKGAQRRGVTWVRPELVGEVEFTEWTDDGVLRHPSFQGLREDKPPEQIVREDVEMMVDPPKPTKRKQARGPAGSRARPSARRKKSVRRAAADGAEKPTAAATQSRATASAAKSKAAKASASNEATVAGVRISSPDRVLYPQQGLTKLGLARYYETIADWVLPHVTGRPLTLVRCPTGSTGQCFYQKHRTDSLPDAVRGVMVEEKGKRSEYVIIDDLAGLVSLVQIGVLEMHPWPAREDNLERPDWLVMDLDPAEDVPWTAVVEGAGQLRDRLEELGLRSFLRTSGGKGLHVVAPLTRRNTWEELKQFAKALAEDFVRRFPDRYVATMSKAKRRGKVFIDYLRNQRGATAIASYSTRARPGAPVATPIAWEELSAKMRADKFNVSNVPRRLAKHRHDPWEDFFSIRQSIRQSAWKDLR